MQLLGDRTQKPWAPPPVLHRPDAPAQSRPRPLQTLHDLRPVARSIQAVYQGGGVPGAFRFC